VFLNGAVIHAFSRLASGGIDGSKGQVADEHRGR
jgi:hypothetical protein